MSLKNGTSYTKLLNDCRRNGVKVIDIRGEDVAIEFFESYDYAKKSTKSRDSIDYSQPELDFNPTTDDNDNSIQESGITEAEDLTEEILTNMLIEDPLQYEAVMKELLSHD
jgi:hypothetical protein